MSGAAAARGPLAFLLQSQSGQWVTITLGAMYAFPEQAKMVLGDVGSYAILAKQMSGFNTSDEKASNVAVAPLQPQSIIIHQNLPDSGKNVYVGLLVKVVVGGTACWLGYFALTNALPEYMQEFFPVTRKFFAKTSKFLVNSIEQVKNSLEKQIGIVSTKQDDLSKKLDGTNSLVDGLNGKLGDAQDDINKLAASMERQESTLSSSYKTTSYTSKGVTLLVRCVASMLPTNDRTVHDLAEYIKDGEEIKKHEEKQEKQRRLQNSVLKAPVSLLSSTSFRNGTTVKKEPPKEEQRVDNFMIRDSCADSDMESLEDVHAVLGIQRGASFIRV